MLTTEKTIVSTALSLIVATVAAQTNQYPGATGTIAKSGYTYKYGYPKYAGGKDFTSRILLYNASASYLNVEYGNRNGTPLTEKEDLRGSPYPLLSGQSMTKNEMEATVYEKFASQQRTALKGKTIIIELIMDTSTGKVVDVYFNFSRRYPFMNIPVETYRAVELALKQKFTVILTAEGRKKNYLRLSWIQEF